MYKRWLKIKQYFNKYNITIGVLITLTIVVFLLLYINKVFQKLEYIVYDLKVFCVVYQDKKLQPDKDIVIITDSSSTYVKTQQAGLEFDEWPWPPYVLAEIIDFLNDTEPKAILCRLRFDNELNKHNEMLFDAIKKAKHLYPIIQVAYFKENQLKHFEKLISNSNDLNYRKDLFMSKKQFENSLKQNGYEKTLKKIYNNFIHKACAKQQNYPGNLKLHINDKTVPENATLFNFISFAWYSTLPETFARVNNLIGVILIPEDKDKIVRSGKPLFKYVKDGSYLPSLSFAPYIDIFGNKKATLTEKYIEVADKRIPISKAGTTKINYRYNFKNYKTINIINIILTKRYLDGKFNMKNFKKSPYYVDKKELKDKYIVMGFFKDTKDKSKSFIAPTGRSLDALTILATMLDNYINCGKGNYENFVTTIPWYITLLITIIFCIIAAKLVLFFENIFIKLTSIFLGTTIYILLALSIFAFNGLRYDLPVIIPVISILFVSLCTFFWQYKIVHSKREEIEKLFGKFVSPQVKKVLMDDPSLINYEGQKKVMTVLFSDLRGFTSISETCPIKDVLPQLNQYLSEMVNIIINEYNGTLDKYMGDAVMAFWGDPLPQENHAELAVKAGLGMQERLVELNKEWKREGRPEFRIGIGINTGEMIVGHLGGEFLLDYTVIGDNVNIASRLESMNKEHSTTMLISEDTYKQCEHIINAEFVDEKKLKGKNVPVKYYKVLSLK